AARASRRATSRRWGRSRCTRGPSPPTAPPSRPPSRRGSCRATRALRTRPCGLLGDREPRRLPSRSSPVQHEVPMTAARGILALAGVTVTLVTLLTVTWLGAESLGLTDERFLRDRLLALASDGGGRPLVALVV